MPGSFRQPQCRIFCVKDFFFKVSGRFLERLGFRFFDHILVRHDLSSKGQLQLMYYSGGAHSTLYSTEDFFRERSANNGEFKLWAVWYPTPRALPTPSHSRANHADGA